MKVPNDISKRKHLGAELSAADDLPRSVKTQTSMDLGWIQVGDMIVTDRLFLIVLGAMEHSPGTNPQWHLLTVGEKEIQETMASMNKDSIDYSIVEHLLHRANVILRANRAPERNTGLDIISPIKGITEFVRMREVPIVYAFTYPHTMELLKEIIAYRDTNPFSDAEYVRRWIS